MINGMRIYYACTGFISLVIDLTTSHPECPKENDDDGVKAIQSRKFALHECHPSMLL